MAPDVSEPELSGDITLPIVVHGTTTATTTGGSAAAWFVIAVVQTEDHRVRCMLVTNMEATNEVAAALARVRVPASRLCQYDCLCQLPCVCSFSCATNLCCRGCLRYSGTR